MRILNSARIPKQDRMITITSITHIGEITKHKTPFHPYPYFSQVLRPIKDKDIQRKTNQQ